MNKNQILPALSAVALGILILQPDRARADSAPPPEPAKLSLQRVQATGLRISAGGGVWRWWRDFGWWFGSVTIGEYGICTATNIGYSWVNQARPVTYSVDIARCEASGVHLLLLPANQPASAPCEAPNNLNLSVAQLTNGTALARLLLTVNSNSTELASLTNSSPVGSWSLTLQGDQLNLQGPAGVGHVCQLPTNVLSAFADPLFVYCFAPQRALGGDRVFVPDLTIRRIQVTGVPEPIDERFSDSGLNTNVWQIPFSLTSSVASASISVVPSGAQYWLGWPLDSYIGPRIRVQFCSTLAPGFWQDLGYATNLMKYGSTMQTPLGSSASGHGFFRVLGN